MLTAADLRAMDRAALMDVLAHGHAIDARALDDTVYNGVSLGLPAVVERATWKKFQKTFCRDSATGALRGWNVRIEQDWDDRALARPWRPMLRRGNPVTFGHYEVVDIDGYRPPGSAPDACRAGLMIDYGRGGNRALDPLGRMRDPIVAVHQGSVELLLGWSYVDLGVTRVGTPSFFSLQRGAPLGYRVSAPAARSR